VASQFPSLRLRPALLTGCSVRARGREGRAAFLTTKWFLTRCTRLGGLASRSSLTNAGERRLAFPRTAALCGLARTWPNLVRRLAARPHNGCRTEPAFSRLQTSKADVTWPVRRDRHRGEDRSDETPREERVVGRYHSDGISCRSADWWQRSSPIAFRSCAAASS
jgi:hypothetical protein